MVQYQMWITEEERQTLKLWALKAKGCDNLKDFLMKAAREKAERENLIEKEENEK